MKKVLMLCFFAGMIFSANAQTALQLNLDKNVRYAYKVNSEQTIQQSVSGQQIAIKVKSHRSVGFQVVEKTPEGYQLEIALDTIITNISAPMMSNETNSSKPGNTPAEKLMNRMSTLKIKALIGANGKFISFVNYSAFRDNMLMVVDDLPTSQKDQGRKQADALVKESAIRSMIEPLFACLPEKPVNSGDTWETSFMSTSNDMTFVVVNALTLKSVTGAFAQITGESTMEAMPSMDPNAAMQQDVKGKSTFEGAIDTRTGLFNNRSENGHFEGTVTVKQAGQEMKVGIAIDSKSQTSVVMSQN